MNIPKKRTKYCTLSTDHWKQTHQLLPNYKNLSSDVFQHLLVKAFPTYYHDQIQYYLRNIDIIKMLQESAQLICDYFQLKIEEDYWNYLANLDIAVLIWLSQLSKEFIRQNSINWDHCKTPINIQNRQLLVKNKLEQVEINLSNYLRQHSFSLRIEQITYDRQFISILLNTLIIGIQDSLQDFINNFQKKKVLLTYDINDAYLVKNFHDLNPTNEQVYVDFFPLLLFFVFHFYSHRCLLLNKFGEQN